MSGLKWKLNPCDDLERSPELMVGMSVNGGMISAAQMQAASKYYRHASEVLKEQGAKMALSVTEKYLKKMGGPAGINWIHGGPLSALRSYLLIQQGKDQAGLDLAESICRTIPTDPETLLQLERSFVSLSDYKSAVEMFEAAFQKTQSEEIGIYLFMAVLRLEDLRRLCKTALSLKSTFQDSRYVFWAAMALYMQKASSTMGEEEVTKGLKLAQHLLLKEFEKSSFSTVQELNLFLLVCGELGDHETGLRVFTQLESLVGGSFDVAAVKSDLLLKTGQYEGVVEYVGGLMAGGGKKEEGKEKRGIYDWGLWRTLSSAYTHLPDKSAADRIFAAILENDRDEAADTSDNKTDKRSLYLARVDAAMAGYGNKSSDEIAESLLAYARQAPKTSSRLPDIVHFFTKMTPDQQASFQQKVLSEQKHGDDGLFWAQLERFVGIKMGAWSQADVERMREENRGEHGLLGLLCLDEISFSDGDVTLHLLKALSHLRKAVAVEPENFLQRILCTIIHLRLGSVFSALDTFRHLDIKQIQIDSLAHLISDHLLNLADLQDAQIFFHEAFFLYDDNRTQSLAAISEACLKQAYARVPEFYELFRRLEHSIQSVSCILQTIRSELMHKPVQPDLVEYLEGMREDELTFKPELVRAIADNRDHDLIEYLDPAGTAKKIAASPQMASFGTVSVWTHTALALLLKAIATRDAAALSSLAASYRLPEYFTQSTLQPSSDLDKDRARFVLALLDAYTSSDDLLTALPAFHQAEFSQNSLPQATICGYEGVAGLQWEVEKLRWAAIALSLHLHACPSHKARKTLAKTLASVTQTLRSHHQSITSTLENVQFYSVPTTHDDADLLETMDIVRANWIRSVENLKVINTLTGIQLLA